MKVPSKASKQRDIPSCATWSQNGTVVAGFKNGTAGSDSMALNEPGALDIDSEDTLYIVDYRNHRVMQWKNGAVSGIQIGELVNQPQTIFVSSTEDIYLTDFEPERNSFNKMYKYDAITNSWITIIRKLPSNAMGFYVSEDQALVYVADYGNNIVMSYDLYGDPIGSVAGVNSVDGNDSYHLVDPSDVFVDEYNNYIYVADSVNNRIQRYKIGQKKGVTVAGAVVGCELNIPVQTIVAANGDIFALELFKRKIIKMTDNFVPGCVCVFGCSDAEQLYTADSFQFDKRGNLYVTDHYKHVVLKFNISLENCGSYSESPKQVKQDYVSLPIDVIIVFLTVVATMTVAMIWTKKKSFKILEFNRKFQNDLDSSSIVKLQINNSDKNST